MRDSRLDVPASLIGLNSELDDKSRLRDKRCFVNYTQCTVENFTPLHSVWQHRVESRTVAGGSLNLEPCTTEPQLEPAPELSV